MRKLVILDINYVSGVLDKFEFWLSCNAVGPIFYDLRQICICIFVLHVICQIRYDAGGIYKLPVNTLRPRQNGRHFADDIFKCIFLNENVWLPIKISLKFVPQGPIKNIPALVQIMAWRRPGDKPLSGLTMVRLPTHICVTLPQWFNWIPCN